ncbi:MAG: HAD family hydrolase [Rhabdochlamydiaceae bacterium]
MHTIKAILFDVDGLMIDSEPLHFQAYKQVLADFGIEFTMEHYLQVWGSDKDMCLRIVESFKIPLSWQELLDRKNELFRKSFIHQVTPKKGLLELLLQLKGKYFTAVVSSSQLHEINTVLKTIGVTQFFSKIISAESVEHGKPSPDCYLLAAEKLGVVPADCLALEDSPKGVAAAKAAGMACWAIPGGEMKNQDFSVADKILESLTEVYTTLKREFS